LIAPQAQKPNYSMR